MFTRQRGVGKSCSPPKMHSSSHSYNLHIEDKGGARLYQGGSCNNGEHNASRQMHKQQDQRGVGKSCSPQKATTLVDVFLFMFLQHAQKRQWWEQDYTKTRTITMANTMQQRKHVNNKTKRGVGMSCSPLEAMAMVDVFFLVLLL